MQQRESDFVPRSPLEAVLARNDEASLDYVTDQLMNGGDFSVPPVASDGVALSEFVEAG